MKYILLFVLLLSTGYAADYNVVLSDPKVYFGGKLESSDGSIIEYWEIEYTDEDIYNNKHSIKEEVVLKEPPYGPLSAIGVASHQIYQKAIDGDEKVLEFLNAIAKD